MGYFDYFCALLQPLGVYDLSPGSYSGAELFAQGAAMDALEAEITANLAEMLPVTAQGAGLAAYEAILPFRPAAATVQARRAAILALLKMRGASLGAVRESLAGSGVAATVEEGPEAGCVTVSFPGLWGAPPDYARVQAILAQLLPAHVEAVYALAWRTWRDVAERWQRWADIPDMTWEELASFS